MTGFEATLSWAVPVKPHILGAHLEAYINLIPATDTLRLCHRFGQNCALSKLPVEILAYIEDILTALERQKTFKEWDSEYQCFVRACDPEDHLSETELEALKHSITTGDFTSEHWDDDDDIDGKVMTALLYNDYDWQDCHYDRSNAWETRTREKCQTESGFFYDHMHTIIKRFGLRVWISHARIAQPKCDYSYWYEEDGFYPAEDTTTYLILPSAKTADKYWSLADIEKDDKGEYKEDAYAMTLSPPAPLSPSNRKAFQRAMRILDLVPYSLWKVEMATIGAGDAESQPEQTADEGESKDIYRAKDEEGFDWPRLTFLVNSQVYLE